jgi:2-dehydro-3-deoxygalactonokinase
MTDWRLTLSRCARSAARFASEACLSSPAPALVSVDWGTTSFRARLAAADGRALEAIEADIGAVNLAPGAHEAFLAERIGDWMRRFPQLPIVLSGMVGSRQGWREAPYVPCPAGVSEIAAKMPPVPATRIGRVFIVPGLSAVDARGAPEVMRGEETQMLGALAASGGGDGLFVLPGTHSKWARVEAGRIVAFTTFMTGEIFAALKDHTLLGRLMAPPGDAAQSARAFARGLAAAQALERPGDLLNAVFMTRTLGLFGGLPPEALADYLSGLLIGAEIIAGGRGARTAVVVGAPALVARYRTAGEALGMALTLAPDNCATLGQIALLRGIGAP